MYVHTGGGPIGGTHGSGLKTNRSLVEGQCIMLGGGWGPVVFSSLRLGNALRH